MKRMLLIVLATVFQIYAQFSAPEFEGFWRGTWFNNTFQSTDSAFITIDVNEPTSTIQIIMDLEGNVFGGNNPEAATMNGNYDNNGFSVSGNSPSYGDLFFSGTAGGSMTGRIPDVPSAFVDSTTLSGNYNRDSIDLVYLVFFNGVQFADGVLKVWKDQTTNINQNPYLINNFYLYHNYPNPFNPITVIQFSLPEESFTKLEIFNSIGEKVSTLVSENLSAGTYKFDWNAEEFTSGVYFYKLSSGDFSEIKKMLLLR
jgi:hypothetical protein